MRKYYNKLKNILLTLIVIKAAGKGYRTDWTHERFYAVLISSFINALEMYALISDPAPWSWDGNKNVCLKIFDIWESLTCEIYFIGVLLLSKLVLQS